MGLTADLLAVVGFIGIVAGVLRMIDVASRTSVWLAASCFCFPPAFVMARHRQPVSRRPFWLWLGSYALFLAGLALGAPVHI